MGILVGSEAIVDRGALTLLDLVVSEVMLFGGLVSTFYQYGV